MQYVQHSARHTAPISYNNKMMTACPNLPKKPGHFPSLPVPKALLHLKSDFTLTIPLDAYSTFTQTAEYEDIWRNLCPGKGFLFYIFKT